MNHLQAAITRARVVAKPPSPLEAENAALRAEVTALKRKLAELNYLTPEALRIKTAVARYYQVQVIDLESPRRFAGITHARHVAMYLCQALTRLTHSQIGKHFGQRDTSTVTYAIRKFRFRLNDDAELQQTIARLERQLIA